MKKLLILYILLFSALLVGVTYQEYNPNDERFKILALKKAQERLKVSEQDFKAAKSLYEASYMSKKDYDSITLQYKNDKLNFQQYLLSVVFDKPHLAILKAEKYQNDLGETWVQLDISNSSASNFEVEQELLDQADLDGLTLDSIHDVFISLQDEQENIISQPYEYHVKELASSAVTSIKFMLLKDVEAVTVTANYGDKFDTKRIWLRRRSSEGKVTLTPNLYSQEVEFGYKASYGISMEYFGDKRVRGRLVVVGLPAGIEGNFINPRTGANISTVMFSSVSPSHQNTLNIIIPKEPGGGIEIGEVIAFEVKILNDKDVEIGSLPLDLIPSGRTSLDLTMNNMYFPVTKGDTLTIYPLTIDNNGQIDIRNISLNISLPPAWEYLIEPENITVLSAGSKQKMSLKVIPHHDALQGLYQIEVSAKGENISRAVTTGKKEIKVEIQKHNNPMVMFILILSVITIIGGVIYAVSKFSKS